MGFFSKFIEHDCPDGTTRLVLKDPKEAFSIVAADWEIRIGALTKALGEAKADVVVKKKVEAIVKELGTGYAELQAHYNAAYLQFCTNPCDPKASERLDKANKEIADKGFKLAKIEIEAEKSLQPKMYHYDAMTTIPRDKASPFELLLPEIVDVDRLAKAASEFSLPRKTGVKSPTKPP